MFTYALVIYVQNNVKSIMSDSFKYSKCDFGDTLKHE